MWHTSITVTVHHPIHGPVSLKVAGPGDNEGEEGGTEEEEKRGDRDFGQFSTKRCVEVLRE